MITVIALAAALLYALSAFVLLGKFVHQEGPNKTAGLRIAGIGVIAHMVFLLEAIMGATVDAAILDPLGINRG